MEINKDILAMMPEELKQVSHDNMDLSTNARKEFIFIKATYDMFNLLMRQNRWTVQETLRQCGFEFSYKSQRTTMQQIITQGIFPYIENNLGYDLTGYLSRGLNSFGEWYDELAYLNHDEFSQEAIHVLLCACYYDASLKEIPVLDTHGNNVSFASTLPDNSPIDVAIDLFILDNLKDFEREYDDILGPKIFSLKMGS